jgi:hypothetical protein
MPYDRPNSRAGVEARWQRLERHARVALRRSPPVTMEQLAAECGVSASYLRYVLPRELKRDLVARYRSSRESERIQLKQRRAEARERITAELIAKGVYPSHALVRNLAAEIQNP